MLSYWEKSHFIQYDYIVIGSGIVGLSTAIGLKAHEPHASVLVLERGVFPSGASTKNAGFACFGSLSELMVDRKTMGDARAMQLVRDRWQGLQMLIERLGKDGIDYQQHGGYELLRENEMHFLDSIEDMNDWLSPSFEQAVFEDHSPYLGKFAFNTEKVRGLIYNPLEGQIDTGKMMKSLLSLASTLDINILTGCEVVALDDAAGTVTINQNLNKDTITFHANHQIAVCTNAFSKILLPELSLEPGRGMVLVSTPVKLPWKGVFHIDEGYYYFRNIQGRVLIGGGRNLDMPTEATTDFGINEKIKEALISLLKEEIIPGQRFEIEHCWSGIMAFGAEKQPILSRVSDKVVVGCRLGGMGIAMGSYWGESLSKMMIFEQ